MPTVVQHSRTSNVTRNYTLSDATWRAVLLSLISVKRCPSRPACLPAILSNGGHDVVVAKHAALMLGFQARNLVITVMTSSGSYMWVRWERSSWGCNSRELWGINRWKEPTGNRCVIRSVSLSKPDIRQNYFKKSCKSRFLHS